MPHRLVVEAEQIDSLKTTLATNPDVIYSGDMTLIIIYGMMKARQMPPVNHKLHPEKHMAWDHAYGWPGHLGTSLNDRQYAEVEAILERPALAKRCVCGKTIVYGTGVGPTAADDPATGLFCSVACQISR